MRRGSERALMRQAFCDKLAASSVQPTSAVTPHRRCLHLRACLLLSLLAVGTSAAAQSTGWPLCGGPLVLPQRPAVDIQREPGEPPGTIHVAADRADLQEVGKSTLIDNVQVVRGEHEQLEADRVVYDKGAGTLEATGSVQLWKDGSYAEGTGASMDLEADIAAMQSGSYMVTDSHARGEAREIEFEGSELIRIKDAYYTTCNPGDADWSLEADFVRIDRVEEVGFARNVLVRFHDVPIFYSPVMTFPTGDKRKSGFLAPSFGVTGETGVEFTVPYYFNLAPNRDATVAARAMSNRGVMAQGEYRYLMPWGEGLVGGEFMPNDSQRDDSRAALHIEHRGYFAPRWHTDVLVDWVSDGEYFEELGTNLSIASQQFLERRGDLLYNGGGWTLLGRVQEYQTLNSAIPQASRPYERLPQLVFATTDRSMNREFDFDLYAETVHFERRDSITGARLDLEPSVSFPIRTAGTFFEPRLSLRHTAYLLDNTPTGTDDSPSRTLPRFSADTGLFLERDVTLGGRELQQTLEPRAYYVYVPYENQDALPVFDTGEFSFSFSQLFRNDRFSGADRMGDANQLTLALTSRLLDPGTGDELVRASIGQIRYFRDQRVQLPNQPRNNENSSDLVADVLANIYGNWRVGAGVQWDLEDGTTDKNAFSVRWQPDNRRIINASYRYVRETTEQTDLSFRWPLSRNWGAVGRWNYAPADGRTLEAFLGFEYESCCWALRAVGRRYLNDGQGGYNSGVFLQLELKGLAGIATSGADFLERSIPGYRPGY